MWEGEIAREIRIRSNAQTKDRAVDSNARGKSLGLDLTLGSDRTLCALSCLPKKSSTPWDYRTTSLSSVNGG